MNSTAILGLATGVPPLRYSQDVILEHFLRLQGTDNRRTRAMRAIFERAGVGFRNSVIDHNYFDIERTTQDRNNCYMEAAVPLGEAVIDNLLEISGYSAQDIDDLIVVSCTGFQIPGLDLHLAGRLNMRSDLHRTCVLGMGCYGAFPGLLRAYEAANQRDGLSLMLSVELCSLHLQTDDSAENVVSCALFADGAAAALVGSADRANGNPAPRLLHFETRCDYQTLDHMAFTLTDHGMRMYLSSYVPDVLATNVEDFVDSLLYREGISRADVRFWGIHPGSSKIVDYVQDRLGLADAQVESSHKVLHDYGNMSSATILFVLDRIQRCEQPSPGDYGVLMAFGPGLTMEGLLVQW